MMHFSIMGKVSVNLKDSSDALKSDISEYFLQTFTSFYSKSLQYS